jgi:hypothetical protein
VEFRCPFRLGVLLVCIFEWHLCECVNVCDEGACATLHTHAKSEMVMDTASLVTC